MICLSSCQKTEEITPSVNFLSPMDSSSVSLKELIVIKFDATSNELLHDVILNIKDMIQEPHGTNLDTSFNYTLLGNDALGTVRLSLPEYVKTGYYSFEIYLKNNNQTREVSDANIYKLSNSIDSEAPVIEVLFPDISMEVVALASNGLFLETRVSDNLLVDAVNVSFINMSDQSIFFNQKYQTDQSEFLLQEPILMPALKGDYEMLIEASDSYNNISEKRFDVIVK